MTQFEVNPPLVVNRTIIAQAGDFDVILSWDQDRFSRGDSIEVAEIVGLAPVTLRAAVRHGHLAALKVGNTWVTTTGWTAYYLVWRSRRRWGSRP